MPRRNDGTVRKLTELAARLKIDAIVQVGVGCASELSWLLPATNHPKLYGFEASPRCMRYWKTAKYPGTLRHFAISDSDGEVTLHAGRHMERASLIPGERRGRKAVVPAICLDTALAQFGPFGERILLWMDAEGWELPALSGGKRFLESVVAITAEVSEHGLESDAWPSRDKTRAAMSSAGFEFAFSMKRNGDCFVRREFAL